MDKTKKCPLVAIAIALGVLGFALVSAHAKYLKEISVPETFPVVVKNGTIQYVDEATETEHETRPEMETSSSTPESTETPESHSMSTEVSASNPSLDLEEEVTSQK